MNPYRQTSKLDNLKTPLFKYLKALLSLYFVRRWLKRALNESVSEGIRPILVFVLLITAGVAAFFYMKYAPSKLVNHLPILNYQCKNGAVLLKEESNNGWHPNPMVCANKNILTILYVYVSPVNKQ